MAKYDSADWHSGGDYPSDLLPENGGTHIGMFFAWAIMNGLEGEDHREDFADDLEQVRQRMMTGRDFLFLCDGKFGDADLNDEGNAFASVYYAGPTDNGYVQYMDDYCTVLGTTELPSVYHAADTWENYDKVAAVIDQRYAEWKRDR